MPYLLNLILPGIGHLYTGKVFTGLALFALCFVGYVFIVPGLLVHLYILATTGRTVRAQARKA